MLAHYHLQRRDEQQEQTELSHSQLPGPNGRSGRYQTSDVQWLVCHLNRLGITGVDLSSDPAHQPLHPGTLAAHAELTDVLLEWHHLQTPPPTSGPALLSLMNHAC